MQGYNIVLWISVGMLLLSLLIWGIQRSAAARARAERARRTAERPELGGDSYFLPPAPIEQAVELANPVEIESLLAGESETVAAAARRQLEATTDIAVTGGLRELSFALPTPAAKPPVPVRPAAPVSTAARPASAQAPRPPAARAATTPTPPDNQFRIPVRELVLAWFEARGYRASSAFQDAYPIEMVLRHRKDRERSYAFVAERSLVTSARASALLAQARASGLPRLLIAAEAGTEPDLPKRVQRMGIRLFDEPGIRAQLGKVDIRVAAKIIAVARSRGFARRSAAAAAAAQARQSAGPGKALPAAKF